MRIFINVIVYKNYDLQKTVFSAFTLFLINAYVYAWYNSIIVSFVFVLRSAWK